jgi:uncharacterized protein YkwD
MFTLVIGYIIGISNPTKPILSSSITEKPLVDYINAVRAKNNVAPLRNDAGLDNTAKLKAEDMSTRNYWAHETPEGTPFYVLLLKERPGLKFYGENLVECYDTTQHAVDSWVASPGHFANMINPRYNIMGAYTAWDNDKGCFITVNHFGQE